MKCAGLRVGPIFSLRKNEWKKKAQDKMGCMCTPASLGMIARNQSPIYDCERKTVQALETSWCLLMRCWVSIPWGMPPVTSAPRGTISTTLKRGRLLPRSVSFSLRRCKVALGFWPFNTSALKGFLWHWKGEMHLILWNQPFETTKNFLEVLVSCLMQNQ